MTVLAPIDNGQKISRMTDENPAGDLNRKMSSDERSLRTGSEARRENMAACGMATPFGWPVDPEEYSQKATSSIAQLDACR